MKPRSFKVHAEHLHQKRLAAKALPRARSHFRASELGGCARRIWFDQLGETPRPITVEEWFRFSSGDLFHQWIVEEFFAPIFVLDGIEGMFNDQEVLNILLDDNPGVRYEIEAKGGKFLGETDGMEFHFRPDALILGLRHDDGSVEMWDPDEWELLEVKSTTVWGVDKARKAHPERVREGFYGWYPSYVYQAQIQMHFLEPIRKARVAMGGRDLYKLIMDQHEPAHRGRGAHPEIDHQVIPYDETIINDIVDKMTVISTAETRPEPGCTGVKNTGDWVYNGCSYNDLEVGGKCSSVKCRGRYGDEADVK